MTANHPSDPLFALFLVGHGIKQAKYTDIWPVENSRDRDFSLSSALDWTHGLCRDKQNFSEFNFSIDALWKQPYAAHGAKLSQIKPKIQKSCPDVRSKLSQTCLKVAPKLPSLTAKWWEPLIPVPRVKSSNPAVSGVITRKLIMATGFIQGLFQSCAKVVFNCLKAVPKLSQH